MMVFSKSICISVTIAAIFIISLSVVNGGKRKEDQGTDHAIQSAQKQPRLVDSCISDNDTTVPPSHQDTDHASQSVKKEDDEPTTRRPLAVNNFDDCLSGYIGNQSKIVLLLDYDGTLTPIVARPELAIIPDETKNVLQTLAGMPNVHIAIISGRGLGDLKDMIGVEGLTYAGNTGLDISFPDGGEFKYPISEKDQEKLKKLIETLQAQLCKHSDWVEDKGPTLTYHYRAAPEVLHAELMERARYLILDAEFKAGKAHCALEAIPCVDWDKGQAALYILNKFFPENWREIAIIYVGDDVNDEYAMEVLKDMAVTFRVDASNKVDSVAKHYLSNPDSVLAMLQWVERHFGKRMLQEDSDRNLSNN
ncbi:uncharacterized protein LOC126845601 isoform X1 [Adelges cooleyi]|uniref:uncharacterized protein LOC126845601 isoform X1 n=1 Tax=Adelges cooleyi TaxID=133065 RepID=UPI00217F828E|nr:uncharacterized protein LOC126845601 isoform X1 [Adelges cooleyi]